MTQTQTEFELEIRKAQSEGIDMSAVLSRREIQFLSGQFTPDNDYARQLRFNIRRKLDGALQKNHNGSEQRRYDFITVLSGKGMGNRSESLHETNEGVLLAGSVGFEPTTYSSGGCRAVHFSRNQVYCCPTLRALQS